MSVIGSIILFSSLEFRINRYLIACICSIISYIGIRKFIKKVSIGIEEIQVNDNFYKLYFFNKNKDPLIISKEETVVSVENDKVFFTEKNTGKFIGSAERVTIENPNNWGDLLQLIIRSR